MSYPSHPVEAFPPMADPPQSGVADAATTAPFATPAPLPPGPASGSQPEDLRLVERLLLRDPDLGGREGIQQQECQLQLYLA